MKKYNVYKATREIKERDISEIVQGCTFFCDGVSEELIKSCDTLDEAKEVLAKYKTDITACDDCYLVTNTVSCQKSMTKTARSWSLATPKKLQK